MTLEQSSQYLSNTMAPSTANLTVFVAGKEHLIQNLEFFSGSGVYDSTLWKVFSTIYSQLYTDHDR